MFIIYRPEGKIQAGRRGRVREHNIKTQFREIRYLLIGLKLLRIGSSGEILLNTAMDIPVP
jgi:hypothetical protein